MAMSNQECIEYLEGWDRLAKMDPKLRKIVVDRAVKGIKLLETNEANAKEKVADALLTEKNMSDIKALCNRAHALMNKDIAPYMDPDKMAEGNPVPEMIFLKNILLVFCEARHINEQQSTQEILDNLIYLYMSAMKPLCRYVTGGSMCAFCGITDCELSSCKTPEEKEKMRKKIEQEIMDAAKGKE